MCYTVFMSSPRYQTKFIGGYITAVHMSAFLKKSGYEYIENMERNGNPPDAYSWHVISRGRGIIYLRYNDPKIASLLALSHLNLETY